MYHVVALYHHPADEAEFVAHYEGTHAKLARQMPGLASYVYGPCSSPDGSPPSHFFVAVQSWDSKEAAQASLASQEGQAATADMPNVAAAGVDVAFFEAPGSVI
ncbi:MAG: EthD family reductase [Actinomycetales bacterium]